MSISIVEVMTETSETLTLPLQDPSGGYYLTDITGLDPVAADIVSTSFGTADGAQFQASRRDPRNIVMTLGFNPDYIATSVRQLRWDLYKLLMPKSKVTLKFHMADDEILEIDGRVETFESALFTKNPSANISIICFDPDFRSSDSIIIAGSTVTGTTLTNIPYSGTMPTGIIFQLLCNRTITQFVLHMEDDNGNVEDIEINASLVSGDILEIGTIPGNKYVRKITSTSSRSVLWAMSSSSSWVKLNPGMNKVRVVTTGAAINYTITYDTRYGGL